MGALTSSRKRNDEFLNPGSRQPHINTPEFQSSKRVKLSLSTPDRSVSSRSTVSRVSRYPDAAPRLRREVHAPVRPQKFGSFTALSQFGASTGTARGTAGEGYRGFTMGNVLSDNYEKVKKSALESLRYFNGTEVIELADEEPRKEVAVSEDSSVETIGADNWLKGTKKVATNLQDSVISELSDGNVVGVEKAEEMLVSTSLDRDDNEFEVLSKSAYQKLLEEVRRRHDPKIKDLEFEIQFQSERLSFIQLQRPPKEPEEEVPREPFVPLTDEEEAKVRQALSCNRRNVLVTHQNSGIEITGEVLQCLRPRAWLNDEVINLYLELLKERERREPKKFLKCHFFNTFFYKKLACGKDGYDYKSVRRWTTQRKLGYSLIDCDKIFVPIHQEVHWCLAIINKKEQKFQYLDSLGGRDSRVLGVLARYIVDEVKDKNGKNVDVQSWKLEYVDDLPEQENSYDCGMFMIKYADFYSRGLRLCFSQEHMPYFRQRTAKEILNLRAD
ncbi:ubiquitin-like-specific protease ESD4 [Punica granatum]|uniref:Uncharacterized protein n=2 Tax=Punica granatum TaxID=22663 RepID=A0A2I0K987_PUNGR|nr:ubiquitin-like-specific protease ESD4 [Punica granatum]PKI65095.1 hypothetical protein CRG98_014564 [Punica granatum]